ncbi:hypothetical protein BDN72DRAFT_118579 [Pluteus cervinus]|uniref:Uncharacterized protein n=1 Tax=Pluteus cervinus TaxID=181527 RepID=A0ACD3B8S2_9AGAR|nr:hypothetical protein BDN72DRAFT_118579 [Pluteus cervinus]
MPHPALPTSSKEEVPWRPTKIMNMRDLAKDDDFLSHLLVEKLGTGTVPLLVHKMDGTRKHPKTDAQELLGIVRRRLVNSKLPVQHATRHAVDDLLKLPPIRYFLKAYTQKQINAFATHASRYFELYHPSGSIEIAHTSRYAHRTGKSELCILATRYLAPGTVITELKGSMANLTDEEDKELKRTETGNTDIRRDFSVIHSKQMKKNHLFLGPARFVNHDCENNCELFREGRYITFRVLRPIAIGEEITAHYGDAYFGKKNRHCLCESCEKRGRGGYAPENAAGLSNAYSPSDTDSDSESEDSSSGSESDSNKEPLNLDERRTRRGVYAVVTNKDEDSEVSDEEDDNVVPLASARDIPADGDIELDTLSELTSIATSSAAHDATPQILSSPAPEPQRCSSSLSSLSSLASDVVSASNMGTPHSIRSQPTHRHNATTTEVGTSRTSRASGQLATPPLSEETASQAGGSTTPAKRVTRSVSALEAASSKGKGKATTATPRSTPSSLRPSKGKDKEEVQIKKEETEPTRVLRARPNPPPTDPAKEVPSKPVVRRGPDGKPLPICCTCGGVLPVISIDSKVVWGLGPETSRKKKKLECPRCIRHFAIYGQPWPSRIPIPGSSSLPTPREDVAPADTINRRVTQKGLSVLDRKLAAAASASHSGKHKRDQEATDERPKKRKRTDPEVQDDVPTSGQKSARSKGEHSKHPQTSPTTTRIKVEEEITDLSVSAPPASSSRKRGRDKAANSGAVDEPIRTVSIPIRASLRNKKRANEAVERPEEHPSKRMQVDDEEELEPLQRVIPRPVTSFPGCRLFCKPNPLSFALKAWASPIMLDESSSEDEKTPITPEDGFSPPPIVDLTVPTNKRIKSSSFSSLTRSALNLKPSPLAFARRRWTSNPSSLVEDVDVDDDTPEVVAEQSYHRRWSKGAYGYNGQELETDSSADSPLDLVPLDSETYPAPFVKADCTISSAHPRVYPVLRSESGGLYSSKLVAFAESNSTPQLVNAGWDSCSDISEL